jgi:ATP-dependent RNA helicase RhlB
MNFEMLNIDSRLLRAIKDRGYKELTSVQEKTLAHTLEGKDAAVQSQTGTGKTAAFLITILESLTRNRTSKKNSVLILAPVRELAVQIEKEAKLLNKYLGYSISSFFGGVGYSQQLSALKNGTDIIIGTPGRLLDLSRTGRLHLNNIEILIIDEADRLFDMGFLPDIKKLLRLLPPRKSRQNMLFSATLNHFSRKIAADYMNQPEFIEVTPKRITVDAIKQELYRVKSHLKLNLMLGILKSEKPQNALIFSNTRHAASSLSQRLKKNGFRSQALTGSLPQGKRLKVINDFTSGKFSFLVATDVAARGLDINDLEMVINYDIPEDREIYVHRIGRTGRAGNAGKAISLICEGKSEHLSAIQSFIGMDIPVKDTDFELYAIDHSCDGFESSNGLRRNKPGRNRSNRPRYGSSKGAKRRTN